MATSVTPAPAEASTFTNEAVAESVIRSTIRSNRTAIKSWLKGSNSVDNLVLEYNGVNNIGRGIMRNTGIINELNNARIVLKSNGSGNYFILTAFPK
ncbi:hypothetical protein MTQ00_08200 [Chryseobacterium sp. B21-037]|uniref:RNase A-like domain-containing protein n=1 Tax=Chryseobacterium sp. B21-037 TaxID=2926038 RepID=UPI002358C0C0|nr:RNase A-like domain-containing protein [Chryseobacterium sp. B21-037]MDC8104518.1 hypothetical protein [Chryseobacterium sp. B21-037]